MKRNQFDMTVEGQWGLYSIHTPTTRGKRWRARKLSGGERTTLGDALMCEGGDRCRAIVADAVADGLRVQVNGVNMKGYRGD